MSETSMPNRLSLKNAQAPGDTARLEHYSPLGADQVRLIQLHSYNDKLGMVECTMTCENLGRSEFLALSYTWGDSTDTRMIVVNDKQFEVTANLEGFLRTFANGYFEATRSKLWIDAICIDQSDISERNSQVLRMSSIYSSAQEVLVWLGEHTQEAAAGYSEIIRFCDRLAEQHDPFADGILRGLWNTLASMSRDGRMDFILHSPWWQRAWILQEFVLAHRVQFLYGEIRMNYHELRNVAYWLILMARYPLPPEDVDWVCRWGWIKDFLDLRKTVTRLDRSKNNGKAKLSLLDLLIRSKDSLCLDPRDRIYSLLGICSDIMPGDIVPDYNRDIRGVYIDAVRAHLFRNGTLDILTGRDPANDKHFPLVSEDSRLWPGWLPRFGCSFAFTFRIPWYNHDWQYNASRKFSFQSYPWSINSMTGALNLSGAVVDVISYVVATAPDMPEGHTEQGRRLQVLQKYAQLVDKLPPVYELTHESTRTALLRTIFATSLRGEDSSVDDIFDRATNANITGAVGQDLIANTSGSTISRRIAITSSGMITLVPVMTDPGDSVVFLVGGSVFYVLRRLADVQDTDDDSVSTKTFRFIGEAYVHGLMDGEVADRGLDLGPISLL
ncbi:heterokaryon incompatibility protein [Colletotrichum asianum]|uniref:Heterokaryon incompatibility protein n=1 Tax=Colletotrichum asianum TaxID=702518 RepID=A0A8H3ZW24_9PEZI|nr:heterokaryon incompatibility protein [Colletotrichum asianum]